MFGRIMRTVCYSQFPVDCTDHSTNDRAACKILDKSLAGHRTAIEA
jgi:hypothetical protein